jgi:hypothetical protein
MFRTHNDITSQVLGKWPSMFLGKMFGSPHRRSKGEVWIQTRKETYISIGQHKDKPHERASALGQNHHSDLLLKILVN